MSESTAAVAAETTIAEPAAVTTSPPQPAQQETPANAETPGAPESNAQTGSGAGEPQAAKPQEGKQGEQEKKRQSAQERIDEVTAKRREAERRAAAAEARVTELEKRLQPPPANAPLEEVDRYERRKDLVDWRTDELRSEAVAARREAAQATYEKFAARADAVADRMPNLIERFSDQTLPVSPVMAEFVADSDKGAEVAHFLAENRNEASRIAHLSPAQQGIELARLEARLSVTPPVRKVSTAPAPGPTVAGNPAPASKTTDEMSSEEMAAVFKKRGLIR